MILRYQLVRLWYQLAVPWYLWEVLLWYQMAVLWYHLAIVRYQLAVLWYQFAILSYQCSGEYYDIIGLVLCMGLDCCHSQNREHNSWSTICQTRVFVIIWTFSRARARPQFDGQKILSSRARSIPASSECSEIHLGKKLLSARARQNAAEDRSREICAGRKNDLWHVVLLLKIALMPSIRMTKIALVSVKHPDYKRAWASWIHLRLFDDVSYWGLIVPWSYIL